MFQFKGHVAEPTN